MALPGKSSLVKVSTTAGGAGAYTTVADLNSATMSTNGGTIDITEFGDNYMQRIQGIKDGSFQISGFWAPADTNGQVAIRNALVNDGELWAQFLPDGTNGFKQQVRVASFELAAGVDGVVTMSASLEGTGAVAPVP